MVVKVYISGISGNKEVKKRQQRVLMILDSKNIKYELIDITEPGREDNKDFMQNNAKSNGGTVSDPNPRTPLPPQMFNDDEYCGDYDQFDLANEVDTLEQFLKVEVPPEEPLADSKTNAINGILQTDEEGKESKEKSQEQVSTEAIENSSEGKETPTDNGETDNPAVRDSPDKENETGVSVEKEVSPESHIAADTDEASVNAEKPKEESDIEPKISAEENASSEEGAIENGAVSSREHSEEKGEQINEPKNVSEALIQSEQTASTD